MSTENDINDEPVIVNFDPLSDDQSQKTPPPIPSDIPNDNDQESPPKEEKQDDENTANNEEEEDDNLEVDYDNPISIPPAVPTDSVRDLMFDPLPQKPGPNISAMLSNASNTSNTSNSLPPPKPPQLPQPPPETKDESQEDDEPQQQEQEQEQEPAEDAYEEILPEEADMPHNATTHNAIFDLDFDKPTNSIIISIKDEITGKSWKMPLTADDFTDGKSIREEYATLGRTVQSGTCSYIYPANNSKDPLTVMISNGDQEYTYTVPDSRVPPKAKDEREKEGTPESNADDDDDDVVIDTLIPTKKTPGIDDNTDIGPTPPPPQPPDAMSFIKVENIDAKDDRYFLYILYFVVECKDNHRLWCFVCL